MSFLTNRSFAYLIAPSNASARDKSTALASGGIVLTGTSDQTIINSSIATYKNIEIAPGTVNISAAIQVIGPNGTDGQLFKIKTAGKFGTIINVATNINGIELTGDPSLWIDGLDLRILGSGNGIVSTAETTTPTYRGFWMSHFKDIYIRGDFSTHTGYAMKLNGPFRSTFENIECLGIANGLYLSADNSAFNPGNCTFTRCFFDLYRANGVGFTFYTPDNGGQFNICKFQQCEAIDSSGSSTTSIGMLFRGSATSYYTTKNIYVDSSNLENFNTAVKFQHSISNRVQLNYVNVANGGTMVDNSSDSSNNVVEILSSYVGPSATAYLVKDANTSTSQPTIIRGAEAYLDTSSNIYATVTATTQIEYQGFNGAGTVAANILNNAKSANGFTVTSPNGTKYKATVSNAGAWVLTSI